jgi:hypothetical protein
MNTKKTFEEWLNDAEWPTPEELAKHEAALEAELGTMWEWAQMQDDLSIGVHTSMYDLDGSHGTGGFTVAQTDKDYEQAKKQYGLAKPGDTFHTKKKLINGQWVQIDENGKT